MKIFTIGHSTLSIDDFIGLLKENKIEMVVDVRSHPGSRYVPWFNSERLKASLVESGIKYCHMSVLGGRKKSCVKEHFALVRGWENESFLNYASYTLTDDYEKGIDELIEKSTQKQSVVMCAESVPWRCHRVLISNTLLARGVDVYHIMNNGVIKHSLNKYGAFAVIEKGKVLYPSE